LILTRYVIFIEQSVYKEGGKGERLKDVYRWDELHQKAPKKTQTIKVIYFAQKNKPFFKKIIMLF
jgi:hypothetical protein